MRLTSYTDYALRVLMQVGLSEGRLVRISEIAERFEISRNHLTKVVHQLGVRGYLETVQGRHGGMRLARSPETIVIGDVVRDFEEGFDLVECFNVNQCDCRIQPACVLKGTLDEALKAFLDVLDKTTLADLLVPRRRLRTLLTIGHEEAGIQATTGSLPG